MTIIEKLQEIIEDKDVYDHDLVMEIAKEAYNLGLETAAEEAETTFDSAYNVVVDRQLILNLKIK